MRLGCRGAGGPQSLNKRGLLTLDAPAGADLYPALLYKQDEQRLLVAQLLDEERGSL
jgi:hypothetical protein